jgi:Concanavalin A-like lectin/glucanases superfamily
MPTLATRLTSDGVFLTNAYFDEITQSWISIAPDAVYAGLFDEVFLASGSLLFSGPSDYLYGVNSVFNIGSPGTAWTFETWIYPQSAGAVFSIGDGTQYGQSFALDWGSTVANKFTFRQGDGSSYPVQMTTSGTYSPNSWYHVAVVSTVTGLKAMYINGIDDASYMISSAFSSASQWVVNGFYDNNGLGNSGGQGHLSNLRFVKNLALYTANFTPPYAPLVAINNTQLLLCMPDNGGSLIDISTNGFKIQSQGSPQATVLKPFTLNTAKRELSTGALQVSGYFDEQSGII